MYTKRNIQAYLRITVAVKINKYYTCMYSRVRVPESVGVCMHVAMLIQHATRMSHTVTSFVTPLDSLHFSILSHTVRFSENVTEHKMCVLTFSTNFV
jgi:hypothetical protein